MKKIYITILCLTTSIITFGQNRIFDGHGAVDNNWNTASNWVGDLKPAGGSITEIKVATTNVNAGFTQQAITNEATLGNTTINGSGPNPKLTLNNAINGGALANVITNLTTAASEFLINCPVTINPIGSLTTQALAIAVQGHTNNTIKFGSTSKLEWGLPGSTGTGGNIQLASNATQKIIIDCEVFGEKNMFFGTNSNVEFGPNSFLTNYTGIMSFYGANPKIVANTADNAVFYNGPKIQATNSGTLTLNGENILSSPLQVNNASIFTLNVNKNQSSLKLLTYNPSSTGKYVITLNSAVTQLSFISNSATNWQSGTVEFKGFKPGVIRFGTDNTGLTATQLSKITHDGSGGAIALDANGYLVYQSSLAVTKNNVIEFSIFPNPVKDVLYIQTQEIISNVKIIDLIGKEVLSQKDSKEINVSSLNKGIYMLQLTNNKGVSTSKIIKE